MFALKKNTRMFLKLIVIKEQLDLEELILQLQVSKRALYLMISEINEMLKNVGEEILRIHKRKLCLTTTQKSKIQSWLCSMSICDFILTPHERQLLLIFSMLTHETFDCKNHMEQLGISKATFYEDIAEIKKIFEQGKCHFEKINQHYKYSVTGTIEYKRILLINITKELRKTIPLSSIPWLPHKIFEEYESRINILSASYPIIHTRDNIRMIITLLYYGYCQGEDVTFENQVNHLLLIKKYFSEYSEQELEFLTFLLYGGFSSTINEKNHLYEVCTDIVTYFENANNILFTDKNKLIYDLYTHLLIYKYRLLTEDYVIEKRMIEQIKYQYHEIYIKVMHCIGQLSYKPFFMEDDFVLIGMMLKLGAALRQGAFIELDDVIFLYIDNKSLQKSVVNWLYEYNNHFKIMDMMDFSYMPEEEKKAKLIITNVTMSDTFLDIPTVYLTEFTIEEKIRIMLLLSLNQENYQLETTFKIFMALKDEMSTHQLQYYIRKLVH